jgi:TPR repeat protein
MNKNQRDQNMTRTIYRTMRKLSLLMAGLLVASATAHAACEDIQAAKTKPECSINLPYQLKQAEKGDAKAQFQLGLAYEKGRGIAKDEAVAAKWYKKSADQGNLDAMHNLAKLYSAGHGVTKNEAEAFRLEKHAAERGHAYAQNGLGLHYLQGRGVPKNSKAAIDALKKSAEQGVPSAAVNLGKLYSRGDGVPVDHAKAFEWYQKAAIAGDADAQFALCGMYRHGRGVKKNISLAYQWCGKAADKGDLQAQVSAGIYAYGYFPEIKPDYDKAVYWWGLAARMGYADAQFLLGMAYDAGKGFPKNPVEARKWYDLSAKQGNPQAIARLNLKK